MSEYNASDLYQMIGSLCTAPFIGVIFYFVKMFNITQYFASLHLVNLVFYPGFYFWVYGKSSCTWESWKAFFPIAICQIIVHVCIFLATYLQKPKDFLTAYYKNVVSYGFQETTILAFNISNVVFGEQFNVISVYYSILDAFLFYPLLKILVWKIYQRDEAQKEQVDQHDPEKQKKKENIEEEVEIIPETERKTTYQSNNEGFEDINQGSDEIELSSEIDADHERQKQVGVDDAGNPDVTADITNKNIEAAKKEEEEEAEPFNAKEADNINARSLKTMLIHTYMNFRNIGILAGIIWSIWAVDFPQFFTQYFGDLKNAVCSCILAVTGALCAHFKLPVFSPWIIVNLAFRYIAYPLVIYGLCKAFGVGVVATKMCMLSSCAPISINAAKRFVDQKDLDLQKSFFVFSWIMYIPFIFIWTVIVTETDFV